MTVISISESRWKEYVKRRKEWVATSGMNFAEAVRGLAVSYQVKGIPHYVLIAPSGKIQDMWSGYGSVHFWKR